MDDWDTPQRNYFNATREIVESLTEKPLPYLRH